MTDKEKKRTERFSQSITIENDTKKMKLIALRLKKLKRMGTLL